MANTHTHTHIHKDNKHIKLHVLVRTDCKHSAGVNTQRSSCRASTLKTNTRNINETNQQEAVLVFLSLWGPGSCLT